MKRIYLAACMIGIFSCNQEKKVDDNNLTNKTMDSITTVQKHSNRIQGPAGLLYVENSGVGNIPVIFLHSFGGSTSHWDNQVEHLSESRKVIAFDFRGHGKSSAPSDNRYTPESLAADIEAVVDSLNIEHFILVGHSMGGAAAIAYAGAHPERVSGLVLAGTPGKTPSEQAKPIIQSLESEAYQKVMDDYMNRLLIDAKPEVNASVMKDFKSISKEASISIIKSIFEFDPLPSLKRYNGPKLIISTPGEAKQPTSLQNLAKEIPARTIEGTSHWTQLDKPDEFNRVLDDFLKTF